MGHIGIRSRFSPSEKKKNYSKKNNRTTVTNREGARPIRRTPDRPHVVPGYVRRISLRRRREHTQLRRLRRAGRRVLSVQDRGRARDRRASGG